MLKSIIDVLIKRLSTAVFPTVTPKPAAVVPPATPTAPLSVEKKHKKLIEGIVSIFESGSFKGNYADLVTYADGRNGTRQITYGRSQTTEQGNLKHLVTMYCDFDCMFADELRPYIKKIGVTPLVNDATFKALLIKAGKQDPGMQIIQDMFFDEHYWEPAVKWFKQNGFTQPLSLAVIYDSFIHSGSILTFLRNRFNEVPPIKGGDEKEWITQYVNTRHHWLANHSNLILRKTIYRTNFFIKQIQNKNWSLNQFPIAPNGVTIKVEDI